MIQTSLAHGWMRQWVGGEANPLNPLLENAFFEENVMRIHSRVQSLPRRIPHHNGEVVKTTANGSDYKFPDILILAFQMSGSHVQNNTCVYFSSTFSTTTLPRAFLKVQRSLKYFPSQTF